MRRSCKDLDIENLPIVPWSGRVDVTRETRRVGLWEGKEYGGLFSVLLIISYPGYIRGTIGSPTYICLSRGLGILRTHGVPVCLGHR